MVYLCVTGVDMHPLAAWRKKNGKSQQELADEIGAQKHAVSRWERGNRSPNGRNLLRLSEVTGIAADDLLNASAAPR